jgi:hypothetical protein
MPPTIDKKKLIEKTSEVLAKLDTPPYFIQDNEGQFRFFSMDG